MSITAEFLIRHQRIVLVLLLLGTLLVVATGGAGAEGLETGIEAACENAGDHAAQHDRAADPAHSPWEACLNPNN